MEEINSIWVSNFEDEDLRNFYAAFLELERSPAITAIAVYISSHGGSTYNAMAMRELIKSSSKPVATIGVGKVMSSGLFLLAAGSKGYRFISNDCVSLMHKASFTSTSGGKEPEIIASTNHLVSIGNVAFNNLALDTGTATKKWYKMIKENDNADLYLTSEQVIKLGIADKIGIPRVVAEGSRVLIAYNK